MNEILISIMVFFAGMILGVIFFGGLWFTVKKAMVSQKSALWFLVSFFIRMGITLLGFYYISSGNWKRLLISVLGFVAARFIVVYLTKSNKEIQVKKEVDNGT